MLLLKTLYKTIFFSEDWLCYSYKVVGNLKTSRSFDNLFTCLIFLGFCMIYFHTQYGNFVGAK